MGNIVDLFSGAGGFSLGAELAGFDSVAAIDVDQKLQSSFKLNFPNSNPVIGDLSKFKEADWLRVLGAKRVDGVIGGPPCQGFSTIGRRQINDERNNLFEAFFANVSMLKPRFFLIENVRGLLDPKYRSLIDRSIRHVSNDYQLSNLTLFDAQDYGAPTMRKRVLMLGIEKPSNVNPDQLLSSIRKASRVTVADALDDLSQPIAKNCKSDFGWGDYGSHRPSTYGERCRRKPSRNLGWSEAKEKLKAGKVSGLFDTKHSADVAERYKNLSPNGVDRISKSKRLDAKGVSPTLRAGTGPERGSYQAVRPIHPNFGRVITVREAARLQGFPDWFVFHPTKWHSFRMIGNSVSPPFAERVLKQIRKQIFAS